MRPLPLIVILGPTAVGKTEMAIRLAGKLDGEIVSADSRLFYRGMDIGTAKPGMEERAGIPHHLIDVAEPDEVWSLAIFQQRARQVIAEIHHREKLPFLVGGTGQYVRAVIQGWQGPPVQPNPHLRMALESWAAEITPQELHRRLAVLDPQAAESIDYRNLRRTIRALEVILTSGRRFSEQRQTGPSPYSLLLLGLTRPRPELYERIDQRIDAMLAGGLKEEVQALLAKGYDPALPSMSAIGYREMIAHLRGEISLDETRAQMMHQTRVFVRRQANWFKPGDPDIHWFDAGPQAAAQMERTVRDWLGGQGVCNITGK
jgi:tRNA dimethylallyltransferase